MLKIGTNAANTTSAHVMPWTTKKQVGHFTVAVVARGDVLMSFSEAH